VSAATFIPDWCDLARVFEPEPVAMVGCELFFFMTVLFTLFHRNVVSHVARLRRLRCIRHRMHSYSCLLMLMPFSACSGLAVSPAATEKGAILPILVYHQIRTSPDGPADGPIALSLERFEGQMRLLDEEGYTTLSMDQVERFLEGEPFPGKVVAIHIDDGWQSSLAAVPVLDRYGFKATFWIIAGSSGTGGGWPHMEWASVKILASNPRFDIFSHTMTHPWEDGDTLVDWVEGRVPGRGVKQAQWELREARRVLEKRLGRPIPYLAWPRGRYNDDLIELAKKAGYRALLTIDEGLNRPGDSLLRIRRTMVDGTCDEEVFRLILADGLLRNCSDVSRVASQ
jgi:peptidoglycan/xylan/chitin deacetylase (PgdA/CDA1 family)